MPELFTSKANVSVLHQSHHYQLIQQAEKVIIENLNYPWTIQDLCKKLYVSQRTLRYAFQKCLGMSPMSYLKTQRLNQVHRQLKASDHRQTTVTDIAIQCGFWHMGQFAQDYRKMFGECPSETLRYCQRNLERGDSIQNHALTI
ncbi:MAG TPA: helix-turn-helix domain-containing protein [Allocoleopsis sp.]